MDVEARGIGRKALRNAANFFAGKAGFDVVPGLPGATLVRRPVLRKASEVWHFLHRGSGLLRSGKLGLQLSHAGGRVDAQLLRVKLRERRMALDAVIAQRLGDGGIVNFRVAVTAVADEIDNDVAMEDVPVFGCE